jgi:hypothetical protein
MKIIKFKRNFKKSNYNFSFLFFKYSLNVLKVLNLKEILQKVIRISVLDSSSVV